MTLRNTEVKEGSGQRKFYCENHFCQLEKDSESVWRCMNGKKLGGCCAIFSTMEAIQF